MNEKEEQIGKIEELMEGAPPKMQDAVIRIISNYEFFQKICQHSGLTENEMQKYKEEALLKEDYMMFAMLCFSQMLEQEQKERNQP